MQGGTRNTSQRLRASKACDRCRRQKLKCDATRPCVLCTRSGSKCETSSQTPRRTSKRQSRVVGNGSSSRSGYSPAHAHATDTSETRVVSQGSFSPSSSSFTSGQRQFNSSTSTIDFARRVFNEEETGRTFTGASVPGDSGVSGADHSLWGLKEMQLPPLPVMLALIDAYFHRMQWFMLLFHEHSFRETAESLISRQVWSRQELSPVISVLAVGLIGLQSVLPDRKWSGHELLQTYGLDAHVLLNGFLAEIRLRLIDICEDCRIEGVQSCILMSSYYVFHNSPSLAWTLFGMAMRIAYALDMQIRPSGKNSIADEIRSRCWNNIIVADTFSSVVYGRPVSIDSAFASLHHLEISDDLMIHPWLLNHQLVEDTDHRVTSMVPFHLLKTEIYSLNRDIILRFRRLPLKTESGVGEVDLRAIAQIAQEADEVLTHWRRRLPKFFDFDYWTCDGKWDKIERQLSSPYADKIRREVEIIYFQAAVLQLTYDAAVIQTQRPLLEQKFHNSTCSVSVLDAMHKSLGVATAAALRISRIPVHKLNNHFAASFASMQQFTAGVILCIQPTSQPFTAAAHEAKEGVMRIIHSSRGFSHYNRIAKQTDELLMELLKVTIERETARALRDTRPSSPERDMAFDEQATGAQLIQGSSGIASSGPGLAECSDPTDQAIQRQPASNTGILESDFNDSVGATQPFDFPSAHLYEHLDSIFGAFGDPMFNLVPEDQNSSWNWGRRAP